MNLISSRENPEFKRLARLATGKQPGGQARQVLLEGIHLCQAWLAHKGMPEKAIFDAARLDNDHEVAALARLLDPGICLAFKEGLARSLSQVEHGQGVYFLVSVPEPTLPGTIDQLCLWLDRIQDPGNVGTLLRTAVAAGIADVYLSSGTASAWSPKVLRSAQGAHFALRIYERVDLAVALDRLAIPLVATALDGADDLYRVQLPAHCAWVLGNEGQGVDPALLKRANLRVFIPQAEGVESLNVAIAAGICLFEQRRQLRRR